MALAGAQQRILNRSANVLARHETCDILGMKHCMYYNCTADDNGSNHAREADSQP